MLRRISSHSSGAISNPLHRASTKHSSSRKVKSSRRHNPLTQTTLGEALAARRASRNNPSNSHSVSEAIAKRRASRRNPSSMPSLREVLASRRNPIERDEVRKEIQNARAKHSEIKKKYEAQPTEFNRMMLEEQTARLHELRAEAQRTASELRRRVGSGVKAPAKKRSVKKSAKKSAKKASTSAKSGSAQSTKAYKALRSTASKTRFTKAYNEVFKKQKRSGKSVAVATRAATTAGKRAASARKNESTADSLSAIASNALRSNPRKKAKKKVAKKSSSRKPVTASAISKHAKGNKLYTRLKSASSKRKFMVEFAKAFRKENNKRGVTEAQAASRAAMSAHSKTKATTSSSKKRSTRRNPVESIMRMNPRKKARKAVRKSAVKRTSSKRSTSLEAAAKKTSLYKKLTSSAQKAKFIKEFKSVYAKIRRSAASDAQANARAAMSAYSAVRKSSARKNPLRTDVARNNPRKRKSSRKSSRKTSTVRARGKRLKGSMESSAKRVLSKYGAYVYRVKIGNKVVELKADKNSSVYKSAKRGGLSAVKLTQLRGKKNTPTSLNLRTVYKTVDGRPSKKDFQKAINAWAGALDGGKIRGVSKKDIARTRMNPETLRRHTVNALANPAPISEAFRRRIMERENATMTTMDKVKIGAMGVGTFGMSTALSHGVSSLVAIKAPKAVAEALPLTFTGGLFGWLLHKKYVQKSDVSVQLMTVTASAAAGSLTSLLLRNVFSTFAKKIPGFSSLAFGDKNLSGYLLDNQTPSSLEGIDMSRLYGTQGLGRYVNSPSNMGSVVRSTQNVGRYQVGQYVPYPSENQLGVYKHDNGMMVNGDTHMRSNPIHPGRISPVGANTQMVPNRASAVPAGMFDVNFKELHEDIQLQEPLSQEDLDAEGLVEVYANGMQMRIIRCVPDVARQVVEANFGSIVGESRVIPGTVLVLANTFDTPQSHTLTDRLRLNRAPEVPKGASFPAPGGVFSRVAFSSLFPSVDNQASFQEFGVRVK